MTFSGFALLFIRPLRHRRTRSIVAVMGVAGGAAMAVAVLAVRDSVAQSVADFHAVGTADLVVTTSGSGGIGDVELAALAALADVDGVENVAPVLRRTVAIDGSAVPLVGLDSRAQAFAVDQLDAVSSGHADTGAVLPSSADGIVLGGPAAQLLDAAVGDTVQVYGTDTRARSAVVLAVIDSPMVKAINGGRVAFAELTVARAATGSGDRSDMVLIAAADTGTASRQIELLQPGLHVDRPAAFVERELGLFRIAENQLMPIAAVSLIVGAVLVFNSVNMSVLERRRQLASLRALGATRRHVLMGVIGQSALLGVIGGMVGTLGGLLIARPVVDGIAPVLSNILGTEVIFHFSPLSVPFAVGGSTIAATFAGIVPARRIAAVDPASALRPDGTPAQGGSAGSWGPRPTIVGSILVLVSVVGLIAGSTDTATSATAGIALGGVVITYGLAGPTATFAARILRRLGGLPSLAAAGITRNPQRIWATSTALTMGIALTIAVAGGAENQRTFTAGQFSSLRDTDVFISASPPEQLTYELRLPGALVAQVAATPGVDRIATDTFANLTIEGRRVLAAGLDGPSSFPLFAAVDPPMQDRVLAGDGVVISHQMAKTFDLDTGDVIPLAGTEDLVVLEVVETLAFAEHGMIVLADETLRSLDPSLLGINTIEVYATPETSAESIIESVSSTLEGVAYPHTIQTGGATYDASIANLERLYAATDGMLIVIVLIGGLAVLNTLFASVLERRRELGILRAIGSSPRQTARIVTIEVATIATIGVVSGLVLGEFLHWAGTTYAAAATPLPVEYQIAPIAVGTAIPVALLAAVLGAIIPIRTTRRLDMLDAIAWE